MTRLNLIEPSHLTNRHLVAEYKEITHFLHIVKMRKEKNRSLNDVPSAYTLNKGHCLFFFDKGQYVYDRIVQLKNEMVSRGILVNIDLFEFRLNQVVESYPEKWFNSYVPTKEAYGLVIDRIGSRINEKPHLYPDSHRFFDALSSY